MWGRPSKCPGRLCTLSPALVSAAAFTRHELLVVFGCLVVLLVLGLAWRTRSNDIPRRKGCERNLKNLLAGFEGYANANEHLPAAGRMGALNDQDWIYWQTDRVLADSALAQYTPTFQGTTLRCAGDTGFRYRNYPYSYSMNVNFEKAATRRIPNHSQIILLNEENSPNDGARVKGQPTDVLTTRHGGLSAAGFMDGHVEFISEKSGVR